MQGIKDTTSFNNKSVSGNTLVIIHMYDNILIISVQINILQYHYLDYIYINSDVVFLK